MEQTQQPRTPADEQGSAQHTERALTPEEAGTLRERMREHGWRSDVGWMAVGTGSSAAVARGEGESVRRTIAYLPSLRAVDGGASRLWKDGDVPAPREADAREVMIADPDVSDWQSESLEAPAETVEPDPLM